MEERLLLYLNKDTWRGEDGIELAEIVRAAWEHQAPYIAYISTISRLDLP